MLYIALGRNLGESPMPEDKWIQFQEEVEFVVQVGENLGYADTRAIGESRYGDMAEETFVMVWFDKLSELSMGTVEALGVLAKSHGQECVAYSVSVTNFVTGI